MDETIAGRRAEAEDRLRILDQTAARWPEEHGEQTGRSQVGRGLGDRRDGEEAAAGRSSVTVIEAELGKVTCTERRTGELKGISRKEILHGDEGTASVLVTLKLEITFGARTKIQEGSSGDIDASEYLAHPARTRDRATGQSDCVPCTAVDLIARGEEQNRTGADRGSAGNGIPRGLIELQNTGAHDGSAAVGVGAASRERERAGAELGDAIATANHPAHGVAAVNGQGARIHLTDGIAQGNGAAESEAASSAFGLTNGKGVVDIYIVG